MGEKQAFNNLRSDSDDFEEVNNDDNCTHVNHSNLRRDLTQNTVIESYNEDEQQQCQEQQGQSSQSRKSSRSRKKTDEGARKCADDEKERRREEAIIRALTHDCFTEEDVAKYFGPNSNKTLKNLTDEDIDGISCQKIKDHYHDTVYVNQLVSEINHFVKLGRSLGVKDIHAVRPNYSDSQIHMGISELTSEAVNFDKEPEEIAKRFRPKFNAFLRRAYQLVPLDNPLSLNDNGGREKDGQREQRRRRGRIPPSQESDQKKADFRTGPSNPRRRK